jgi:hypothetical protein
MPSTTRTVVRKPNGNLRLTKNHKSLGLAPSFLSFQAKLKKGPTRDGLKACSCVLLFQ